MRETGLLNRAQNRQLQSKPICAGDSRDISMVGFHEIKPVLLSYLLAVIVSMFLLALEIHVHAIAVRLYDKKKPDMKSKTKAISPK